MTSDYEGTARDCVDGSIVRKTSREDLAAYEVEVITTSPPKVRLELQDGDDSAVTMRASGLLDLMKRGEYYAPENTDIFAALRDLRDEVAADA